jgi:2-oxoglutarate dehydrogenase complex dehydrogenase (E1) component-like enzyme
MAARIAQQPTVREQYAAKLVEEGVLSEATQEAARTGRRARC